MIREQIEAKMILSEVHFMLFAQPVDLLDESFQRTFSVRKYIKYKFKDIFRENFILTVRIRLL